MHDISPLIELAYIFVGMLLFAWITTRAGLGPILGYLIAGLFLGEHALDLIHHEEVAAVLGELGVVFLMFMIGLELPIARIKTIGIKVLALGFLQVFCTTSIFVYICLQFGMSAPAAVAVAAGLSFSSTTIVLRQLTERAMLNSKAGRNAFAILMVQDLLVGPILIAVLALGDESANLPLLLSLALIKGVAAVVAISFYGGRVLDFIFKNIALTRTPELFTMFSLLVVLGIGLLTYEAGLSLAFGGFLAGMVLADTQYRHQIAADVRALRGPLLGVFFVFVGLTIDPGVIVESPLLVIGIMIALMLLKWIIILVLALSFRFDFATSWKSGLMLAQGGEFGFVLWQAASDAGVLGSEETRILIVAVALSMAVTPFIIGALDRIKKQPAKKAADTRPLEELGEEDHHGLADHIVVIGGGRVGEQVLKALTARGTPFIVLDHDEEKVRRLRKLTPHAYLGDAMHHDILETVHVADAIAIVIAVNDHRQSMILVGLLKYLFSDLPILVRAQDEDRAKDLEKAGATTAIPEVLDTGTHLVNALFLGGKTSTHLSSYK